MMALSSVGTHGMTVGLVRSISFSASSSEKRGMMMISAPGDGDVHHHGQREHVEERQHAEHPLAAMLQIGAPGGDLLRVHVDSWRA